MMAFECSWLGDTKKKVTKKKAAWSATVMAELPLLWGPD